MLNKEKKIARDPTPAAAKLRFFFARTINCRFISIQTHIIGHSNNNAVDNNV